MLPFVDILKSGGNVFDIFGFKNSRLTNFNIESSSLEDEDVKQERADVHQYLTDGYRSKVCLLFKLIAKLVIVFHLDTNCFSK